MPRISDFTILAQPEQPIIKVTQIASIDDFPNVIGQGFLTLGAYEKENNAFLIDVPYVSFRENEHNNFTVSVCMPLLKPLPSKDSIVAEVLPERKIAFCMYLGPYDPITPVYEEMRQWVEKQGYKVPAYSYEQYYNGQNFPEEHLLTKIVLPLE